MKAIVAKTLATRVQSGQVFGIGSGSTVEACIEAIGKRIDSEKLAVYCIATSTHSAACASAAGIRVLDGRSNTKIDWAFDGADEIDKSLNLIKGGGGALLQEKILARKSGGLVVVATEEKLVSKLGQKFLVPIEIIPEACSYVKSELSKLGSSQASLRVGSGIYGPVFTEQGNQILDVKFSTLSSDLDESIKLITGVVDTGLFYGLANEVLVAKKNGVFSMKLRDGSVCEEMLDKP